MAANDASTAAAAANAANAPSPAPITDAVRSRDWMFCPVTGALLELDAERGVAWSPVSGFERQLEGEIDTEKKKMKKKGHWLDAPLSSNVKKLNLHLLQKQKQTSTPSPSSARQTSTTTAAGTSSHP